MSLSEEKTYKEVINHYIRLDNDANNQTYRKYLVETYMLESCPKPRVLDLGCGTGWYSTLFETYTGIDSCKEMIDYAKINYSSSCLSDRREFIHGDIFQCIDNLISSESCFDLVIMQAFIHLFDPDTAKQLLTKVQKLCPRTIYISTTRSKEARREYAEKEGTGFYRKRTFYTLDLMKQLIGPDSNPFGIWDWHIYNEQDTTQNKEFFVVIGKNTIITDYEKKGLVVLPQKIPIDIFKRVDEQSEYLRRETPIDKDWVRYGRSTNLTDISRVEKFTHKMPELFDYLNSSEIQLFLEKLLGAKPVLYKEKLNYKLAGDPPFPPHQDVMAGWPKTKYVTLGISIDASTQENGCLWFVPEKHHSELSRERAMIEPEVLKSDEWVCMPLGSGSIILFDGLTPHRSFPNLSGKPRRMIFVTYGANLPLNIKTVASTDKINRQPPVDEWQQMGIRAYVRDTFGKFITHPPKYTTLELAGYDFIILLGKKNVGKDTCGAYLSKKIGWNTYAMARPVKEMAKIAFHLTDSQVNDSVLKETPVPHLGNRTPRFIMQTIFTELFTHSLDQIMPETAPLFFVHHMERELKTDPAGQPKNQVIITDLRSPIYARYLQKKYRTLILKITRPSEEETIKDNHSSETDVMQFQTWDWLIENNGTIEDLYAKLDLLF